MDSTIAGFFDSSKDATCAADALVARGFGRDQISVLARDPYERSAGSTDFVDVDETRVSRAEKGAMLGGFAGLLVGLAAVLIPGVGPFLVLGPAATALVSAGLGATAGGLLGGLTKLGIPHDHAEFFVEGMKQGGTLLLVAAPASSEAEILEVFRRNHAVDVGERIRHEHMTPKQPPLGTSALLSAPVVPSGPSGQPGPSGPPGPPAPAASAAERRAVQTFQHVSVPVPPSRPSHP